MTFLYLIVTIFMCYQAFSLVFEYKTPFSGAYNALKALYNTFLLYKTIAVGSDIRKQVRLIVNCQRTTSKMIPSDMC